MNSLVDEDEQKLLPKRHPEDACEPTSREEKR
jgi:hypothetical protein